MAEELRATFKKMALTQFGDVVRIELHCAGPYFAAVLFEDLEQRFRSGQSVIITIPSKVSVV